MWRHVFLSATLLLPGFSQAREGPAAEPVLFADILPGPNGSYPRIVFAGKRHLFFSAIADAGAKPELMVWDSTTGRTHRGMTDPSERTPVMFEIGDRAFFIHRSAARPDRIALWSTGGTMESTRELVVPDEAIRTFYPPPFPMPGQALFIATQDEDWHLWRTDGTKQGTVRLCRGYYPFDPNAGALPIHGKRWMIPSHFELPDELVRGAWVSDGTAAGTQYVPLPNLPGDSPSTGDAMVSCKGAILFIPVGHRSKTELWRTDATNEGTRKVKTIHWIDRKCRSASMQAHGDAAYFVLHDANLGWDLWRTDGTELGTVLLKSMQPYRDLMASFRKRSEPPPITSIGRHLIFGVDDGTHGQEPWVTDGTAAGTRLLKDCNPGPESSDVSWVRENLSRPPALHDGKLLFWVRTKDFVDREWTELWSTDGTESGTRVEGQILEDRWPNHRAQDGALVGDTVLFSARDAQFGDELWMLRLKD